ncbi:MAG: response regulator [Myxococcota bacterium]
MPLAKDRLQQLIAHSRDIICATDRKGKVVYYNDGASRILGYAPDEIMGCFVGQLYPSVDEARRVMDAMRDEGHGGLDIVETFQTAFLAKSGAEIPVAISGTLLRNEQGEPDGTIGFAKDLREILHKDQLATLGEVAVGLSHEINNPLAVVLNQTELLEKDVHRLAGDADCSVETERIDAMRREIGRISEILERLSQMVQTEVYETVEYIGPARMIDLRKKYEGDESQELTGLRILVADDDMGIQRTLKEILEADGCIVDTASDGVEALKRINAGHLDLVLTDVVMPNMDGYELYQAIRRDHPQLPVLMMTAFHYDRDHVIKRSRLKGLEGVIFKKPVDPKRLREVIRDTVGKTT